MMPKKGLIRGRRPSLGSGKGKPRLLHLNLSGGKRKKGNSNSCVGGKKGSDRYVAAMDD